MKLVVQGIEEIELTDPQGLCNPQMVAAVPQPRQGNPIPNALYPTPQIPTPRPMIPGGWGDPSTIKPIPTGDVAIPYRPSIYTRHIHEPNDPFAPKAKWDVGGEAIQRAGQQLTLTSGRRTGNDPDNGNRSTH